jgi:type I restriction enzyme, S subunit
MEGALNPPENLHCARRRFKPYPAYKDSGVEWVREIPAHWVSLALSRVSVSRCDGPFGSSLKSEHYSNEGVRVVRLQNIGWAEFSGSDEAYIDDAYAKQLGDHSVVADDLLIAGLGDEGHPVGRACTAPQNIEPAMVKADCFRFRLDQRRLTSQFAAYQLSATASATAGLLSTGSTRSRINLTATAARKITLPPIQEQEIITGFLDRETARIDALVAKKEQLIALLQERRTALITRAITKGLDPNAPMKDSGFDWVGDIPEHWVVRPLKHFLRMPLAYGVLKPDKYDGVDGVRLIRILDVEAGHVREEQLDVISPEQSKEYGRTIVKTGDLVVSVVGTIGRAFIVPPSLAGANLSRALARIQLKPSLEPPFLEYSLASASFLSFVELIPAGTAQKVLNLEELDQYPLAAPLGVRDQQQIVQRLNEETEAISALIRRVRSAIDCLKELRTALISEAVTGKIDVRGEAA